MQIDADIRAVVTSFCYALCNGTLQHGILGDLAYQEVLIDEPSATEAAVAIFLNCLELDEAGKPLDPRPAEQRSAQYLRAYIDPNYVPDPPLTPDETRRHYDNWPRSGPMP